VESTAFDYLPIGTRRRSSSAKFWSMTPSSFKMIDAGDVAGHDRAMHHIVATVTAIRPGGERPLGDQE
jgi:hypothetical protein